MKKGLLSLFLFFAVASIASAQCSTSAGCSGRGVRAVYVMPPVNQMTHNVTVTRTVTVTQSACSTAAACSGRAGTFSGFHARRADVHAAKADHARLAIRANYHDRRASVHTAKTPRTVVVVQQAPNVEAKK